MQPSQRAVTATASEISSRTLGSSLPIFAAPSAIVRYPRTISGDAWPICWMVAINCFRYSSQSIIMAGVLQFSGTRRTRAFTFAGLHSNFRTTRSPAPRPCSPHAAGTPRSGDVVGRSTPVARIPGNPRVAAVFLGFAASGSYGRWPAVAHTDSAAGTFRRRPAAGLKTRGSERRRIVPEHRTADDLHRRKSLPQEGVVELLQPEAHAHLLPVVVAELEDLQLSERVDEVRRVARPSLRLHQCIGVRQVPFLLEELYALLERHPAGVHPDPDHIAGVAQERILQLAQAHLEERGVLLLGDARRAAVAFLEHHLLGVVRPAFQVRVAPEQLAHLVRRPLHPEELDVVARVRLVDRGADDDAAVEPGHVLLHLLLRPGRLRQGDVEERLRRPLLERSGGLHGGDRGCAHERGRLLHDWQHRRGNGDDAVLLDEAPQVTEGVAERLQQLAGRRMVRAQVLQHLLRRTVRPELSSHTLELALVAAQIGHADLQQMVEGQVHRLFEEQLLAEG